MKKLIRQAIRIYRGIARRINKILITSQLKSVGNNFICDQNVIIFNGQNVEIGENVVLNWGVLIQSCEGAKILIGNNVTISYDVKILTGNLTYDSIKSEYIHSHRNSSVSVGNNVWIGSNSIILPGVQIADNIVIAAGSLVNKSLTESNHLYAGIPAKKIKLL